MSQAFGPTTLLGTDLDQQKLKVAPGNSSEINGAAGSADISGSTGTGGGIRCEMPQCIALDKETANPKSRRRTPTQYPATSNLISSSLLPTLPTVNDHTFKYQTQ